MSKELRKFIVNKSRLINKYLKWSYWETFVAYKKVKNKCNTLTRKTKKRYFEYIAEKKNFPVSNTFRNKVRTIITKKATISDEDIKIKAEENQNIKIKNKNKSKLVSIKTNDCFKDKKVLVEMFKTHYINIAEKNIWYCTRAYWRFLFAKKWWRSCKQNLKTLWKTHECFEN